MNVETMQPVMTFTLATGVSVRYPAMRVYSVRGKEMNVQAGSHARMELPVWMNLMITGN